MIILGLTGSIGMGKSTTADMFRVQGIAVYDADAQVHRIMAAGGSAVAAVEAAFPGVTADGAVNRARLGEQVFNNDDALTRLENILHPIVRDAQIRFLCISARARRPMVLLDIPLLFETGGDRFCDAAVVVSAPASVQRQRVMSRPGMTATRFDDILLRQMSDVEKRHRADFIVPTGLGRAFSFEAVRDIIGKMSERRPRHWPPSLGPSAALWRRTANA